MMSAQLIRAVKGHKTKTVKRLLDEGRANVDDTDPTDQNESTPLYWASTSGFEDICSLLLLRGAATDIRTSSGATALHAAADNGKEQIVYLLISSGADCNVQDNKGNTPLHLAAYRGYLDVCRLLVDNRASLRLVNKNHKTPSQEAQCRSHYDIFNMLQKEVPCSPVTPKRVDDGDVIRRLTSTRAPKQITEPIVPSVPLITGPIVPPATTGPPTGGNKQACESIDSSTNFDVVDYDRSEFESGYQTSFGRPTYEELCRRIGRDELDECRISDYDLMSPVRYPKEIGRGVFPATMAVDPPSSRIRVVWGKTTVEPPPRTGRAFPTTTVDPPPRTGGAFPTTIAPGVTILDGMLSGSNVENNGEVDCRTRSNQLTRERHVGRGNGRADQEGSTQSADMFDRPFADRRNIMMPSLPGKVNTSSYPTQCSELHSYPTVPSSSSMRAQTYTPSLRESARPYDSSGQIETDSIRYASEDFNSSCYSSFVEQDESTSMHPASSSIHYYPGGDQRRNLHSINSTIYDPPPNPLNPSVPQSPYPPAATYLPAATYPPDTYRPPPSSSHHHAAAVTSPMASPPPSKRHQKMVQEYTQMAETTSHRLLFATILPVFKAMGHDFLRTMSASLKDRARSLVLRSTDATATTTNVGWTPQRDFRIVEKQEGSECGTAATFTITRNQTLYLMKVWSCAGRPPTTAPCPIDDSLLATLCSPLHSIAITPANTAYFHAWGVTPSHTASTVGLVYSNFPTSLRGLLRCKRRLPEMFVMHTLYQLLRAAATRKQLTLDNIYFSGHLRLRVLDVQVQQTGLYDWPSLHTIWHAFIQYGRRFPFSAELSSILDAVTSRPDFADISTASIRLGMLLFGPSIQEVHSDEDCLIWTQSKMMKLLVKPPTTFPLDPDLWCLTTTASLLVNHALLELDFVTMVTAQQLWAHVQRLRN